MCSCNYLLDNQTPLCLQAAEFLELVKKYKDFGFKEDNILNCLQAANNDEEKALEYLCSLGST